MKKFSLFFLAVIFVNTLLFAKKEHRSFISIDGTIYQRIDRFNKFDQLKKRFSTAMLPNVNITISIDQHNMFNIPANSNGQYEMVFNLEPHHVYQIKFEKEGFYPKIIEFDTKEIETGKELKIKSWDIYLFPKIEGIEDSIFFKPLREAYEKDFGSMTYDYVYNENLEREQEKMYRIYRELEVNTNAIPFPIDSTVSTKIIESTGEKIIENPVKSKVPEIKEDLYHSKSIEKEDSLLSEMRIHIHTQKAQLELDKLKAQTHEDKKAIQDREQEILLAETEILLAEQEIENARRRLALQNAENKGQRVLLMAAGASSILLLVFVIILYWNIRNRKRINQTLKSRNADVIAKNDEILDSIKYAKRLQKAILPPAELIASLLPTACIYYKPKDIVSGDFYWVEKSGEEIYFAAVDCTGHGVPGAFMSIIGYNGLNQAIKEYPSASPAQILDELNSSVSKSLHQQVEDFHLRDGMDISLCKYNPKNKTLEFAGAYNHLYVLRNYEFIKYNADKRPIGAFSDQVKKPFTNHLIQLESGDSIFIFTDGYVDQFGGDRNKKLKIRNFKQILTDIHDKQPTDQRELLNLAFNNWKQEEEQVDDVLVMSLKIL